ncbi:transposase [Pseudomonas synxantha]|uniref:Transposase n=1 Tax=Pseudomonas synxantha TaxID=47883 RepID=A0ABS0UED9_9PSED|nr:Tn3 family transposase post-transcriptional regulator TnpC [Pseudomonas synxantha]MBI6563953.1 transposase [Pseudomonas synxantha]MBI6580439.1 transposase [Pseudomonas synxantha]MBI6642056.1 transposase [Pseudomonas synxantha]
MNIPPALFRVTPYGEVDAEALERLRDDYDTTQLLRLVDGLDLLLKEMNNFGGLRDGLLRIHAMAKTVLDGAALSVSVTEVGSIWEEAESLDEDLVELGNWLASVRAQLKPLIELMPVDPH